MDRQRKNPSPRVNGERGRGEGRWPHTSTQLPAAIVALLFSASLHAASMTVEPREAALDQPVTITITLDGDLARLDAIDLPLENLVIESGPSVSSQFEWVNGVTTRRKLFRWIVYPETPGESFIGPVPLESRGESEVLPRIGVSILPDPLEDATSAEEIAQRLVSTGRDRIFIFPEIDRTDVFVGEQVVVTWYLYTAESIRDLDISSTPSLREFWSEEIPLTDEPTREVRLAGISMQRLPIRRVALFPLQSGTVNAGRLVAIAEVMRPIRNRFGVFSAVERRVGRVVLRSSAPVLRVQALPAGTRGAVGTYELKCTQPRVPAEGPVSFDVMVTGEGNLRSAQQPVFSVSPEARVEVEDRGVTVTRAQGRVTMSRNWRFIVFPRRSGRLEIPAVVFHTWDPETGTGAKLECSGGQVTANVAPAVMPSPADETESTEPSSGVGGLVAGLIVLMGGFAAAAVWWRSRGRRISATTLELIRNTDDPAAMRLALHEVLSRAGLTSEILFRDGSELGETFRSLQSLLDIRERETLTADRSPEELESRAREFGREFDRAMASRPPGRGKHH